MYSIYFSPGKMKGSGGMSKTESVLRDPNAIERNLMSTKKSEAFPFVKPEPSKARGVINTD